VMLGEPVAHITLFLCQTRKINSDGVVPVGTGARSRTESGIRMSSYAAFSVAISITKRYFTSLLSMRS
jgi:hypothetical protein